VLGQLLVAAGLAPWLPPIDQWQSGLLPYPLLLASQILILGVLATVCLQFSRGHVVLASCLLVVAHHHRRPRSG
jgi:hypothetical protein